MKIFKSVYTFGDRVCMSAIVAMDVGIDNIFILGDQFMQIFYSVYDRDTNRVGLAKSRIYQDEFNMMT